MAKKTSAFTVTEDGEIINNITYEPIAMAPPFWKTPYNHDREHESLSTGLLCEDESKTQQSFAKDADINNILRKFMQTGELPPMGQPQYMDVDDTDLQDRIVTSAQVEAAWNELPAAVRNILKDPHTFTEYVDHCLRTGDLEPLQELGLATKPQAPEPASPPGGVSPAPRAGEPGQEAGKTPPDGGSTDKP